MNDQTSWDPALVKKFSSSNINEGKKGRPLDEGKLQALKIVIDEFYESEEESITVSELIKQMEGIISQPYDERSIINRVKEMDDIFLTQTGKGKNIITTKLSASEVLSNFHKKKNSNMTEDQWKIEIIDTAAALVKAQVDQIQEDRNYYPDISSISDVEKQLDYVPFLLRSFLTSIFKKRKTDMKITIAAIGQAIMQQQRPRSLMTPMQFALTMRVHDDCPGLVNDLFKNGFCLSEAEAKLFKASAASDRPNPFSLMTGKFGWIIGDNFDHNKITLTGHDTIHVMGLMVTETPSSTPPHRITRYGRDILNKKSLDHMIPIKDIKPLKNPRNRLIYNFFSNNS